MLARCGRRWPFCSAVLLLIFVVPLLPFLRFLMGVLAWAVTLFEAVAAMPIVALAHLSPVGEGLSGALARQAYMLWLGLFVRPVLTLFGFVIGFLLFVLSVAFLNAMLSPFAQMSMPANDGLMTLANLGLVLLYDVLVYAAVNASFKAIHWLPEKALRWLSNFTLTDDGRRNVAGDRQTLGSPAVLGLIRRRSCRFGARRSVRWWW